MSVTFFFSGVACVTFALAGMLFLKFWRASGDRLFRLLCAACWMLSLERIVGLINYAVDPSDASQANRSWIYLIRLAAFLVILLSVIDKNRSISRR